MTVHNRRRDGVWLNGKHCAVIARRLYVNIKEADKWIKSHPPNPAGRNHPGNCHRSPHSNRLYLECQAVQRTAATLHHQQGFDSVCQQFAQRDSAQGGLRLV